MFRIFFSLYLNFYYKKVGMIINKRNNIISEYYVLLLHYKKIMKLVLRVLLIHAITLNHVLLKILLILTITCEPVGS